MPTVPQIPGGIGASGSSPMAPAGAPAGLGDAPSQTNLLMAAAEIHQSGKLQSFKQPNPAKPHAVHKKLKVIK